MFFFGTNNITGKSLPEWITCQIYIVVMVCKWYGFSDVNALASIRSLASPKWLFWSVPCVRKKSARFISIAVQAATSPVLVINPQSSSKSLAVNEVEFLAHNYRLLLIGSRSILRHTWLLCQYFISKFYGKVGVKNLGVTFEIFFSVYILRFWIEKLNRRFLFFSLVNRFNCVKITTFLV